jgi:hypothetical protein
MRKRLILNLKPSWTTAGWHISQQIPVVSRLPANCEPLGVSPRAFAGKQLNSAARRLRTRPLTGLLIYSEHELQG